MTLDKMLMTNQGIRLNFLYICNICAAPKYVTVQIYVYTSTRKNSNVNVAVCSFDRSLINAPGPCVLFATPGMISGGFSLEVFRQWAPCEGNLIMLPGYDFHLLTYMHVHH